ncbi:hypothetical protein MCAP1_000651 [Malassezia caprae]|uniref:DNA recombination and repair protein Rad51-like C-terminal domain-containing protein n=1 Tax=Malassezia caprae TaxID=1381934 RepID=A0AAF0E444_9BASI|nr:hypothetical protein MCAP1_000651 [Malassezia caprae]
MHSGTPRVGGRAEWAPLRAAELLPGTQQGEERFLTPLSQLPIPTWELEDLPSPETPALAWEPGEEEVALDVADMNPDVVPIVRNPLRHLSGLDALDQYVGQWHSGGAFARPDAQHEQREPQRGFPVGSGIEIVGPPGTGKTRWCIQMAISERRRHIFHTIREYMTDVGPAVETERWDDTLGTFCSLLQEEIEPWCAHVVLIDTEGSMHPGILAQMAQHTMTAADLDELYALATTAGLDMDKSEFSATAAIPALQQAVLCGIHLVRPTSLGELVSYLGTAASSVLKIPGLPPRTSLLIVDSLSFFTYPYSLPPQATREQRQTRSEIIEYIVRSLTTLRDSQLPEQERLTIIVTMQMSTAFSGTAGLEASSEQRLIPSLVSSRTTAEWGSSVLGRSAVLDPAPTVPFQMHTHGLYSV